VAYVPVGTIEWHGVHNPTGADTLQAEGLAIMCAQKGGGLVFPPLYYGESRLEALMEANAADRDQIAAGMNLSPDNFKPERQPFTATEQAVNYHKLLLHVLAEVESLGFKLGVLVAGHDPLLDHCRAAVLHFNQREAQQAAWHAGVDLCGLSPGARSVRTFRGPRWRLGDVARDGAASRYG
jgi:creatinine amidohydrolase